MLTLGFYCSFHHLGYHLPLQTMTEDGLMLHVYFLIYLCICVLIRDIQFTANNSTASGITQIMSCTVQLVKYTGKIYK